MRVKKYKYLIINNWNIIIIYYKNSLNEYSFGEVINNKKRKINYNCKTIKEKFYYKIKFLINF